MTVTATTTFVTGLEESTTHPYRVIWERLGHLKASSCLEKSLREMCWSKAFKRRSKTSFKSLHRCHLTPRLPGSSAQKNGRQPKKTATWDILVAQTGHAIVRMRWHERRSRQITSCVRRMLLYKHALWLMLNM